MTITNKLCLPQALVNIASDDGHRPVGNQFSVTELLKPVREILLARANYDKIERDVADCVPAIFGTAVHKVLEDADTDAATEVEVGAAVGKYVLVGRIDALDLNNRRIWDYKTCSANKVIKQDFEDWRLQGLMYSWLTYRTFGVRVCSLTFYALMKDWSKVKAASDPDYPQSAIHKQAYTVLDSDYDYIEKWIKDRFAAIEEAEASGELPECTAEERWYTGTKYAAMKDGRKTAVKVFSSRDEAAAFAEQNGLRLEERPGEYLKCKLYCDCCRFCKKGEQR